MTRLRWEAGREAAGGPFWHTKLESQGHNAEMPMIKWDKGIRRGAA